MPEHSLSDGFSDTATQPWLTVMGWGENGTGDLSISSIKHLEDADVIFGAKRHLTVLPLLTAEVREWPVPFSEGIAELLTFRGKKVVMLVSGDPFWFGAGTVMAKHLEPNEWTAIPSSSSFSLASAKLGWGLEKITCLGLHAAPLTRVRPHLQAKQKIMVLLRDGDAVSELAELLKQWGFTDTQVHVFEALGGERERISTFVVDELVPKDIQHPVMVGLEVGQKGQAIPRTSGLPEHWFKHDGQITKQNIRAITLAALSPRSGERLWDIGAGSGSISIEWLLSDRHNQALAFERNENRASNIRANANNLGVDYLDVVEGSAVEQLERAVNENPLPDVIFIGGGLSHELLERIWQTIPAGTRLVANAVTLESESVLTHWHAAKGGELIKIELSQSTPIGSMRGWKSNYPVVQWRVTL